MLPLLALLIMLGIVTIGGCSGDEPSGQTVPPSATKKTVKGCQACHPFTLDKNHLITCVSCHYGNDNTTSKAVAHNGLIAAPAHPDTMTDTCGKCHEQTVHQAAESLHFTMANITNKVRKAFGAQDSLQSMTEIPEHLQPASILELTDDLLRRRCLRCHLYYRGDDYPATTRGTGCAACHLAYENGQLVSHQFIGRPNDRQCLSCHYSNTVGADFHGRFEQDFNWDYQTPFTAPEKDGQPPYGLHYHQLSPDIHQRKGMICIDCHSGEELMTGNPTKLRCESCHTRATNRDELPPHIRDTDDGISITLRQSGASIKIPQAVHPAHEQSKNRAGCLVCHAQWGFHDQETSIIRLDDPDFEEWFALLKQGSSEVESALNADIFFDDSGSVSIMADKITGKVTMGVWFKGYKLRRWEPAFCLDRQGILQVCRPILDLNLSYVNKDGDVIFDSVTPAKDTMKLLPYTPHTVGPAGSFYQQRLTSSTEKK